MTAAAVSMTWSVDRAAGIAALALASLSVCLGLLQSRGVAAPKGQVRRDLRPIHEALSIAALAAIGVHVVAFMADQYIGTGIAGALVPFGSSYEPFAVGLGQLAFYGLVAFSLSFYARRRIGPARWRLAHRSVALFWLLAVGHAALIGTDAAATWLIAALLPLVVAAAAGLAWTWSGRVGPAAPDGDGEPEVSRAAASRTAPARAARPMARAR